MAPIIWVTAAPEVNYQGETVTDVITRQLDLVQSRWDWDLYTPNASARLSPAEVVDRAESLTVAGIAAVAVEFRVRGRTGGEGVLRFVALKYGNAFWLFDLRPWGAKTLEDHQGEIAAFLASITFNY